MKKSTFKKAFAVILAALMVFVTASCGGSPANVEDPPVDLPTATSTEAGLYVLDQTVVDETGAAADGYSLDEDGNIVDDDGDITIAAENVAEFVPVTGIGMTFAPEVIEREDAVYDEETEKWHVTLEYVPNESTEEASVYAPKELPVDITLVPANATCREYTLEASDEEIATFFTGGSPRTVDGTSQVTVIFQHEGEVTITVKAAGSDDVVAEITVVVANGEISEAEVPDVDTEKEPDDAEGETETAAPTTKPEDPAPNQKPTNPTPTPTPTAKPENPAPTPTPTEKPADPTPTPEPTAKPTTHTHNWQAVTEEVKVVDQPATEGHYETEHNVPVEVCTCGQVFYSHADWLAHTHVSDDLEYALAHGGFSSSTRDVDRWVEGTPEVSHMETVVTGYICTECGETKPA